MSRTVDLVVIGDPKTVLDATVEGVRRGRRVLVVLRSGDARATRRFRRDLRRAANGMESHVTVIANAAVVCVDGVDRVEVVVIRHARTGRLSAVNASAFVSCDEGELVSRERGRCSPGSRVPRTSRRTL